LDPFEIALDELGLRRAPDLPARDDVEQHLALERRRAERQLKIDLKPS